MTTRSMGRGIVAIALSLWSLLAASVGCGAILGVDFGQAYLADATAEGGASDGSADAGPSPFEVVHVLAAGDDLHSVWAVDDKTVFAVGTRGVKLQLAGGDWMRSAVTPGRDYHQVWGTKETDIFAVGEITGNKTGFVEHFDGLQWTDEYIATTPLNGVWSDGIAVYAAGPGGNVYGRSADGKTPWSRVTRVTTPDVLDIQAVTGNGQGSLGLIGSRRIHWATSPGDFQWIDPTVDETFRFFSAWGAPGKETDILLGTNYQGIVWMNAPRKLPENTYDATRLSPEAGLDDIALTVLLKDESDPEAKDLYTRGVWGFGTKRYLVGDRGRVHVLDTVAGELTRVPSGTTDKLHGVWASKDTLWVVGARELIMRAPRP